MAIALRNRCKILNMVSVEDWAFAVDRSCLPQKVLTMEAQPQHWGDVVDKHVPLREWVRHVFGGNCELVDELVKHPRMNTFASFVIISCVNDLPIGRQSADPVKYLVADYENICKVYAIILIVMQLPEQLSKRVKLAFGYKY